jgi:hypothetical protein
LSGCFSKKEKLSSVTTIESFFQFKEEGYAIIKL